MIMINKNPYFNPIQHGVFFVNRKRGGGIAEVQMVLKTPRSAKLTYVIFVCHMRHMT